MSPFEIEILLHYGTCAGDFPNLTAPAVQQALKKFCNHGILKVWEGVEPMYKANHEAMNVYLKAVCAIELPKQKWVIE